MLSKSDLLQDIKYVHAVGYQDVLLGHLDLKDGTNWLSQNIRTELPLYTTQVSQ